MNKKILLEDYIKRHSFLEETIKLHQAINEAVGKISPIELVNIDDCAKLTAEGVSLLQHKDLQDKITEELLKLSPQVVKSLNMELNETLERLIKWAIIEKLIPANLKSSDVWEKWLKNYCPVCGRKPILAQLRKEQQGRARYLCCGGCHTMWRWNRVGCTYCENEDLYKMKIFEVDAEPQMRIDVCDECKTYIKTYNEEGDEDIYLTDWLTYHFDLLAEDKGYQKVGSVMLE